MICTQSANRIDMRGSHVQTLQWCVVSNNAQFCGYYFKSPWATFEAHDGYQKPRFTHACGPSGATETGT